jgi:GNAT superfamily N-acetyltransferase
MCVFQVDDDMRKSIILSRGKVIVSRGKQHDLSTLPGYAYLENKDAVGWIFYSIINTECEIVTLDSKLEGIGVGSRLIQKVVRKAIVSGCVKVWLITSNDNINAIRFYQKRGFEMVFVHIDAITEARRIKPTIPLRGHHGIPIKHEIEFEYKI